MRMQLVRALLDEAAKTAYATEMAAKDDVTLVEEIRTQISAAGYERTVGPADQRCTILYQETVRRNAPHLYQRGWNRAARDEGVELDPSDILRAQAA